MGADNLRPTMTAEFDDGGDEETLVISIFFLFQHVFASRFSSSPPPLRTPLLDGSRAA